MKALCLKESPDEKFRNNLCENALQYFLPNSQFCGWFGLFGVSNKK